MLISTQVEFYNFIEPVKNIHLKRLLLKCLSSNNLSMNLEIEKFYSLFTYWLILYWVYRCQEIILIWKHIRYWSYVFNILKFVRSWFVLTWLHYKMLKYTLNNSIYTILKVYAHFNLLIYSPSSKLSIQFIISLSLLVSMSQT